MFLFLFNCEISTFSNKQIVFTLTLKDLVCYYSQSVNLKKIIISEFKTTITKTKTT